METKNTQVAIPTDRDSAVELIARTTDPTLWENDGTLPAAYVKEEQEVARAKAREIIKALSTNLKQEEA